MAQTDEQNAQLSAKVRVFQDFLDADRGDGSYADKINDMIDKGKTRLLVDIADLRENNADLARKVLNSPAEYLPAFDKALAEAVANINPEYGKETRSQFSIGFEGNFGAHHVTPRNLSSGLVNKLISINGIVTKCSLVRPKVLKSVHYCETTKVMHQREYRDATSFSGLPTGSTYMTRDDDGNVLSTEYGLCEYADSQGIHLQEMPEHTAVGQLPRSVDILITNDLVDQVKPGDRVQIVGVYKPLTGTGEGGTSGMFRTVVIGVAVRSLAKELLQTAMTTTDIDNIKAMAKRKDVFEAIARSLAPSICGHEWVKRGLLLQLLGGQEKNLHNGTHIRGDINLLMVGDPSVAKSQLMRYIMNIAPLAVSTTGRGSSGVGLTAAVTQDSETGERKLEAGAMVLADRGMVCIDEFDKMSDQDRVAIHEVMEQQTVTIAKAGIHTSLNARCSVVAAANPVYGSYDKTRKTTENIGLPDSLLSRFDLLFILLDTVEEAHDKRISDHVLRQHRYKAAEGAEGERDDDENEQTGEAAEEETAMLEKYNPALHGSREAAGEIFTQAFLKKYIRYAKRVNTKLSSAASELISKLYAELRSQQDIAGGALPITPRTLETIIRLSTAHCKLRLGHLIEERDVRAAYRIMMYALTNDTPIEEREIMMEDADDGVAKPKKGGDSDDEDDDESDDDDNDGSGEVLKKTGSEERARKRAAREGDSSTDKSAKSPAKGKGAKSPAAKAAPAKRARTEEPAGGSAKDAPVDRMSDRYAAFEGGIRTFFEDKAHGGADDSPLANILKYINNTPGSKHKFTQKEASSLATDLAQDRGEGIPAIIMFEAGNIYKAW